LRPGEVEQNLPVEMYRRFAADAAHYFGAALADQTASRHQMTALDTNFGRWLKQVLSDIKMKGREG
jgi:hypothetical protein